MAEIAGLASAVAYWLNYKNLTGLAGLFSEASLTVPVAEFLKSQKIYELHPQVTHPNFRTVRGRPRQLDFVAKNKNRRWLFAIEAKYFPFPAQRISNDIGRLLKLEESCEKYIVIAGPSGIKGARSFQINMKIGGHHRNVMYRFFTHTRREKRIIKLKEQHLKIRKLFYNFMVDYKINKMPNAFEISCIDFRRSKLFAVGIWKLRLRSGTGTILRSQLLSKN